MDFTTPRVAPTSRWVVLTRALTRNAIMNLVRANEILASILVSVAFVSGVFLANERCH